MLYLYVKNTFQLFPMFCFLVFIERLLWNKNSLKFWINPVATAGCWWHVAPWISRQILHGAKLKILSETDGSVKQQAAINSLNSLCTCMNTRALDTRTQSSTYSITSNMLSWTSPLRTNQPPFPVRYFKSCRNKSLWVVNVEWKCHTCTRSRAKLNSGFLYHSPGGALHSRPH